MCDLSRNVQRNVPPRWANTAEVSNVSSAQKPMCNTARRCKLTPQKEPAWQKKRSVFLFLGLKLEVHNFDFDCQFKHEVYLCVFAVFYLYILSCYCATWLHCEYRCLIFLFWMLGLHFNVLVVSSIVTHADCSFCKPDKRAAVVN